MGKGTFFQRLKNGFLKVSHDQICTSGEKEQSYVHLENPILQRCNHIRKWPAGIKGIVNPQSRTFSQLRGT